MPKRIRTATLRKGAKLPLPVIDATLEEIANQRALLTNYRRSLRRWEVRLYRLSGWKRRHQKAPMREVVQATAH